MSNCSGLQREGGMEGERERGRIGARIYEKVSRSKGRRRVEYMCVGSGTACGGYMRICVYVRHSGIIDLLKVQCVC